MFGFTFPKNEKKQSLNLLIAVLLFGIFFGGLMEICQHFIFINRSGNWYDFIANTIGAILGVILYPQLIKLLPLKR
jgi:VanZ family protein